MVKLSRKQLIIDKSENYWASVKEIFLSSADRGRQIL